MKLSEYLYNALNTTYLEWVQLGIAGDAVRLALKQGNFDIEVTEPNPNLVPFTYIEMHHEDCSVVSNILKEKLAQYKEELDAMKDYLNGFSTTAFLPRVFLNKDDEIIRENINPWISQIHWAEYQIEKFENASKDRHR